MRCLNISLICGLLALSPLIYAEPFSSCPSKAFLFQGEPVSVYGVNLATGNYTVLQDDAGMAGNINGLGFNEADRYIYGFNTTTFNVVQIDNKFKARAINVAGLPSNTTFYVGDTYNHYYYLYRKGSGFYKINLQPLDTNPNAVLTAQLITSTTSINITDFAFHPNNNHLYAVDNGTGVLHEFDLTTGKTRVIGNTGVTGTFGAAYFDVDGYLYLSRNNDGFIYRIDLAAVDIAQLTGPTASLFANGPSSNQNDGARCAQAPIINEDEPATIDFGDAPASYGTLLQDNGARHALDGQTYLGFNAPTGKYNGPDNSAFEDPDDDGVGFVTALQTGLDSVIQVVASTEGYLNAWFDWNRDGDFDDAGEQLLTAYPLTAGANNLIVRIPEGAQAGQTWARFRFSQQATLNAFGGSTSGEVEDYSVAIDSVNLSYTHYPSANSWTTLAFEDNWPQTADYDMNDVVFALRYTQVVNLATQAVERVEIRGKLLAMGGSYHSGFAIRIPGVAATAINTATLQMRVNDIRVASPLEPNRNEAIFIINAHLNNSLKPICSYYRTQANCDQPITFNFDLSIPFNGSVLANDLPKAPFDPFIFAANNYYHGPAFAQAPGRSYEVHLPDQAPTEAFNADFFGLQEDTTNASEGRYFRTHNNLPWAMEMSDAWQWPKERVDLLQAYPLFSEFVLQSGASHTDWYLPANANLNAIFNH